MTRAALQLLAAALLISCDAAAAPQGGAHRGRPRTPPRSRRRRC